MAKPMTEAQIARWRGMRARGWLWFVFVWGIFRYGLPWGALMLLAARLLDLRAHSHSLGFAHELRLWGIGGVLFGVFAASLEWLREERRFREADSASGSPTV